MTSRTCVLLFILAILSGAVTAQNYGCFTTNGTYSTNLNSLISSFPPNIQDNGFYNGTAGQAPDRAYATALCRTDFQLEECCTCLREAVPELLRLCPNRRQGILFRDKCTLRYSNESLADGAATDGYTIYSRSPQTARNPEQFNQKLWGLLKDLRTQAAAGGPLMKTAAGNETGPSFQDIFALVQCRADLSEAACKRCLISAEQFVCCENNTAVLVLMPRCTLQYDAVPFYNITRIQEVQAIVSPLPPPPPPPVPPPSSGNTNRTVIIILVPILASLLLAAFVGIIVRKRFEKKDITTLQGEDEVVSAEESLLYDFKQLVAATNNFSTSNKLGEGGFGAVYKGKLRSGQQIAVKRLSRNSGQGELEFKNEVLLMAKLQHRNLTRLLGFSLRGSERLLVYEFVQNGSLDCSIFDPMKRSLINWESRYKIIKGIAWGLVYLHEESCIRIIHRDLKASNILLDGDKNPKISDFGMARLFQQDETRGNTRRIVGTFGYMAPEYARHGDFSIKSDVFSFGVLVLEIICGQSNSSFKNVENGENVEYMLSYAWRNWCAGRERKLIDPALMSASTPIHDVTKCIHIGLLCVQKNARDRPPMASVLVMLHSFSATFSVPLEPAFFVPGGNEDLARSLEIKQTEFSKNEALITELHPR
ncbi:putative receptor-like protein kinase At4g00960 [Salvia splendens]|uniref:putative receptor-like protein kinase At4g00960 n=1 Tax=Salvia splendens TaxID=180675 RepID=UPI001C275DDE|nr:putative receptor-like protein kinase At4g00960 [Salvia splendens]